MKYKEFTEMMLQFTDELEKICQFRDSIVADEVETDSEEQLYLKEEMLILTEMFDIDSLMTAIRYYNKPTLKKGYIKLVNGLPVLQTDTEQIVLHMNDWIEYAMTEYNEPCYNADDIYFYNLSKVKEFDQIDNLQIQIRA